MSDKFRCNHCGKFLSYDQPVIQNYTPDSEFTREECETICMTCERKERLEFEKFFGKQRNGPTGE